MHNYLWTHLLGYIHTYIPKNKSTWLSSCFSFVLPQRPTCHHNYLCTCPYLYPFMTLPVHVHTFILINHWDLPVNVSTALHLRRCTCPTIYDHLWSILLTAEIYSSTFLLLYMYADAPVHQYTFSVYFFLFGITCTVTFPLICGGMYTQIHLEINLHVYLHASLLPKNKDLPVTTTTCVCTCP